MNVTINVRAEGYTAEQIAEIRASCAEKLRAHPLAPEHQFSVYTKQELFAMWEQFKATFMNEIVIACLEDNCTPNLLDTTKLLLPVSVKLLATFNEALEELTRLERDNSVMAVVINSQQNELETLRGVDKQIH